MNDLLERAKSAHAAVEPYIACRTLAPLAEVYDLRDAIRSTEARQAACIHGERRYDNGASDVHVQFYQTPFCPACGKQLREILAQEDMDRILKRVKGEVTP